MKRESTLRMAKSPDDGRILVDSARGTFFLDRFLQWQDLDRYNTCLLIMISRYHKQLAHSFSSFEVLQISSALLRLDAIMNGHQTYVMRSRYVSERIRLVYPHGKLLLHH